MGRVLALAILVASLVARVAAAQQIEMKAPEPEPSRPPEIIVPGPQTEITRPGDTDRYPPAGPQVPYEPAWVAPMSTRTATGHAGIAGWTSPSIPVGAAQTGHSEVTGWLSFGFAFAWGGPPAEPPVPPRR